MNKSILFCASTMKHINNFHLDYIEALEREGYRVFTMARGEGADFNIPFEKSLSSPRNIISIGRIRRIIKRMDFDVIILNTSLAAALVRMACPSRRRPRIINTVHGYLFSKNTSRARSLLLFCCEKLLSKKTDSIITMNAEDYRIATRFRLARGKVYRTRGMGARIRDQISNPENLRAEFAPPASFIIAFVGELSERKNQEFLIRAMPKIQELLPEALLWLIGDGEARSRLGALALELGVERSVVFVGERQDACDFIRAADLYVSPASIEGMPINVIEALGAGKTVLASRIKGHEDLIVDSLDGFLYEYGNIDEFVNKTCQIYNKNLKIDIKSVEEKYKIYEKDRVMPETLALIEEAIT